MTLEGGYVMHQNQRNTESDYSSPFMTYYRALRSDIKAAITLAKSINLKNGDNPIMQTPLGASVSSVNSVEVTKILLARGADPNQIEPNGNILLQMCCNPVLFEHFKLLIHHRANPNLQDPNYGRTTLMFCKKYPQAITLLLSHPQIDINLKDKNDKTALMHFLEYGKIEDIKLLLDAGAEVNIFDRYGKSVFEYGLLPIGKNESHNYYDENGRYVISEHNPDQDRDLIVSILLQKDINMHLSFSNGAKTILLRVLTNKRIAEYEQHIDAIVEYAFRNEKSKSLGELSLVQAIELKRHDIAKKFIKHGANVNIVDKNGSSILERILDDEEMAGLILENGANPNFTDKEGNTLLIKNIDNFPIVKLLLDFKADPNIANNKGITPLWIAINNADERVIEELIAHNVNVNEPRIHDGMTPLMVFVDNLNMVKLLVEHGADLDQTNNKGETVLLQLSRTNDVKVAEYLLMQGANPNIALEGDYTALMEAAYLCKTATVNLLLEYDAQIIAKDQWGDTALTRARHKLNMVKYESPEYREECEKTIKSLENLLELEQVELEEEIEIVPIVEGNFLVEELSLEIESDLVSENVFSTKYDESAEQSDEKQVQEEVSGNTNNCWYGFNWLCDIIAA